MPKPEESQLQFSSVCLTVNTYFSSSENLLLSVKTMLSATEQTDVTLPSVDNNLIYSTRQAGFALNRTKQLDNLTKDTDIMNYDMVANNFNENVNVKCNSGFYIQVASPALHSLAKQTCDPQSLVINNIKIKCSNSRISLDNHNLMVNSTYFFDLLEASTDIVLGKVTVHCHVTTKVVQLQGSRVIDGTKAPVWFFTHVLENTFARESSEKGVSISKTNNDINSLASYNCTLCDKKYKTPAGLQRHTQTKHEAIPGDTFPSSDTRVLRKRRCPDSSTIDYGPPLKTVALGSSVPTVATTSEICSSSLSSTLSLSPTARATMQSLTVPTTPLFQTPRPDIPVSSAITITPAITLSVSSATAPAMISLPRFSAALPTNLH